ncbi:MAG: S8 family serine peptidase, partial [bacterium]
MKIQRWEMEKGRDCKSPAPVPSEDGAGTSANNNRGSEYAKQIKGAAIIAALFLFALAGCGGQGSGDVGSAAPDEGLGQLNDLETLMYTESFSGKLVVRFEEGMQVRLKDAETVDKAAVAVPGTTTQTTMSRPVLFSAAGQDAAVAPMQQVLDAHPAALIVRATDAPEAEVDRQRARLERLSGQKMPDWNSAYRIDVGDPDEAVKVMRELSAVPGVKYVYPEFKPSPAGLDTTPALTGLQGYLYAENTSGGLNAQAAWSQGVHGQDVYIVDNEHGINLFHADLSLVNKALFEGGSYLYFPDCVPGFIPQIDDCDSWIAHGTAVAGILVAQDNGHGTTGFAPAAKYVNSPMSSSVEGDLRISTDGFDDPVSWGDNDLEPGSVWVLEVQLPGKYTNLNCTPPWDAACEYGMVPVELWPDVYDAIQQATAYGVTVIEGSGNGAMDLNNPALYSGAWSFAHNMATDDAGAIMVGASEGANEKKISFSNCGTRVNTFAWGQGVVTTGYAYGPYKWNGSNPPVPPNSDPNSFFVDMFGGTSSAAAMVGGAAALVQSYARQQLGHKRYIMPFKMREFIVNSGVAQKDSSGCNIGKQPRIDQALTAVDAFLAQVSAQYPQLASDEQLTDAQMLALRQLGVGIICKEFDPTHSDLSCPDTEVFPSGVKIAKTYDFDGDGRADLMKFENGKWYVDLSSKGTGGDNYGAWDLELTFPAINGRWVWPYVEDMNSDGRADFVAYDKEHGKFYVALTDTDIIRNGVWHGWDWQLDYSSEWQDDLKLNPDESNYSRPALGNYNGDQWADIGIYCSDGSVRVDYGAGTQASFSGFEWTPQLLTSEMLAAAPGWAYLTVPEDFNQIGRIFFAVKVPDTLPDEGRMYIIPQDNVNFLIDEEWMAKAPHIFGGNEVIPGSGVFPPMYFPVISIKEPTGRWRVSGDVEYGTLTELPPSDVYGDTECHPVTGDFDGDGITDRTVMCPGEWRIAY